MYVPDRTSLFGNCRFCEFKALSIFSVEPFRNAEISPQNIRPDLHYSNFEKKKFQELNFNQIEKKSFPHLKNCIVLMSLVAKIMMALTANQQ